MLIKRGIVIATKKHDSVGAVYDRALLHWASMRGHRPRLQNRAFCGWYDALQATCPILTSRDCALNVSTYMDPANNACPVSPGCNELGDECDDRVFPVGRRSLHGVLHHFPLSFTHNRHTASDAA